MTELSRKGVSFKSTLTLGRQQLFFNPSEIVPYLVGLSENKISRFLSTTYDRGPAEPFLELLGAEKVTSMDFSDYEGATIQHDLNRSIDSSLHERFDVVIDGGTLEHVFNFPTAIRNAMEMVRVGGSLLIFTPANNQLGHGFYQFSPELFYNVLSATNGYQVKEMVAIELSPAHCHYKVADPSELQERVTLTNSWPVSLFVHAERTKKLPLFNETPQQTDYQSAWVAKEGTLVKSQSDTLTQLQRRGISKKAQIRNFLISSAPSLLAHVTTFRQVFLNRSSGFKNSRFFKERSSL
ncbi:MAG: hypothetical protein ACJ763_14880 [Bdellovibrionia bacterium]